MKSIKIIAVVTVGVVIGLLFLVPSCQHDLVYHNIDGPIDTTHIPIDTTGPIDTFP